MSKDEQNDVEFEDYERDGEEEEDEVESDDDEDSEDNEDNEDSEEEEDNKMETLNEAEYKEKFEFLEKSIAENPYGYENYVAIIKLLREQGEFKLLREYRTKMSEIFPLSESKAAKMNEFWVFGVDSIKLLLISQVFGWIG